MKSFLLNLPDERYYRLKDYCMNHSMSRTKLLNNLVREFLLEHEILGGIENNKFKYPFTKCLNCGRIYNIENSNAKQHLKFCNRDCEV